MATATSLSDGGFIGGSYDVTIDGYSYTLDTTSHDLPVTQADAMKSDGTPKGGLFVIGKRKVSVKINAITGTPAPSQLVAFNFAFDGMASAKWAVTNLKIDSANTGAHIRTYTADLVQQIN